MKPKLNPGFAQIIIVLVIVTVAVVAYYLEISGSLKLKLLPTSAPSSSSPSSNPEQLTKQKELTPNPKASSAKKLVYFLPAGWKTVRDNTETLELGYDPKMYGASSNNLGVDFWYLAHPGSFSFGIRPYDGGSRHQFIYKELGYTAVSARDKTKDYHEREYSYNGWSCLILYGLTFSAKGTTWGMCPITPSRAIFIEGPNQENTTEPFLRTIKVLK